MRIDLMYAKTLKVEKISGRMWDVGKNIVKRVTKKGRSFFTCSCTNHSRFPNESFCSHKLAVVYYESTKDAKKLIKEYIDEVEKNKKIKMETNNLMVLDMLEQINKLL